MANRTSGSAQVSPAIVITTIVVVVVIAVVLGWKTLAGGTSTEHTTVDVNKVKQDFKVNGMGNHGRNATYHPPGS